MEGGGFGCWRSARGWGNAVQTDAVVVLCCPYHCCAFGLVSSNYLMIHGAAWVWGRRTDKIAVDGRTRGGMGGYDRGKYKYNRAKQGWERLQYI